MTTNLFQAVEERFGIKADPDDIKKLQTYLRNNYGGENQETIEKIFSSGEAAGLLTVNETYFFREPAHFTLLRDLLPSFEQTMCPAGNPGLQSRQLQICCAAVATGCEAYSIAMLIEAYNKGIEKPLPYHIDAFDINPKVIETACEGAYSARALREDGSCFQYMAVPYLKKLENGYRIDDSLKKNICFFVHNLMDELPPKDYDIIFFRNAFIYISPRYRERILSNLAAVLKEDGLLIMGVSETAGAKHAAFDSKNRKDVFYFQKIHEVY
jgi:chemotaxis protein methyltransferase CheR